MSSDLKKARDSRIKFLYDWEFSMVCHHLAKFGGCRYCISGDIIFLVCRVITQNHVLNGQVTIAIGVPQCKSPPGQVWWS